MGGRRLEIIIDHQHASNLCPVRFHSAAASSVALTAAMFFYAGIPGCPPQSDLPVRAILLSVARSRHPHLFRIAAGLNPARFVLHPASARAEQQHSKRGRRCRILKQGFAGFLPG